MQLSEILDFTNPVYAHTGSKVYTGRETLQEHTERCQKYFERLLDKEKMRDVFDRMEPILTGDRGRKYADWFWQTMRDVITFHDTGKMNPVFQREAMANEAFEDIHIPNLYERNHAGLSAYIYLDYQIAQLERLHERAHIEAGTRIYLYEMICMNAYLIMKHHSNLGSFDEFVAAIQKGGRLSNIEDQMTKCNLSEYLSKLINRMGKKVKRWDMMGNAEITRDKAEL